MEDMFERSVFGGSSQQNVTVLCLRVGPPNPNPMLKEYKESDTVYSVE